jgi:hypothetical protein
LMATKTARLDCTQGRLVLFRINVVSVSAWRT